MLLLLSPDGFIDRLQKCALSSYGTETKIWLAEKLSWKNIQKASPVKVEEHAKETSSFFKKQKKKK